MNSRILPADLAPFSRMPRTARASDVADPDAVDLRALGRAIWRGKWQVILCAAGLGFAAWLLVSRMEPSYDATAKLMLDPRKAQIVSEEIVRDLDLSEQVVNGEAAVLRSNVLIEQVVAELGPKRIDAKNMLDLTDAEAADLVASVESPDDRSAALDKKMQTLVWMIRRDLAVYPEGDSYVIALRTSHTDPVMAARIANALGAAYIEAQIEVRRNAATGATLWLSERVSELRDQLDAAETAVAEARAEGLAADGGMIETVRQQIADLNGQLVAARADRVAAEARTERLRAVAEGDGLEQVAELVSSPIIDQLWSERMEMSRQDARWADRYGPDHPQRQRIVRELEQIDTQMREEVRRIVAQRESETEIAALRETSLQRGIADLEAQVVEITRNAQGVRQLQREAEAKRQTYESLLSRLTETRTQEQLQQPDAKLIERASVPSVPARPRPKLMAALGVMGGMALGLGLILVRELTTLTFRTARDLEAHAGLPVIASVPRQRFGGPMAATAALRDAPYTPYGERIRHLRTALLMRDGRDEPRAVAVLSSAPGEGKTTTTLALAQMSVLAGKSVCVIDGDLRRSSMHAAFGWDMEEDFADFIRGDCALDRAIYTDPEFGFDFLAARGPQPDVADKLSTGWLREVVDELKRCYDVVLIDAPAALAVSDALVLAQVVDTRVYLVRWDDTPRRAVTAGLVALEEMGLDVAGTVLTMVDPDKSADIETTGYTYTS